MAMANAKGSSDMRNFMYPGKHFPLPPRTPSPGNASAYGDYFIPPLNSSKAVQKPIAQPHHHRTTSESILIEEQPSWLDDLLNEPETPVRRGHRRSSSDSFAYVGGGNFGRQDYASQEEYKARNMSMLSVWGSQDFERQKEGWHAPFYAEVQATKKKNWVKELNVPAQLSGLPSPKDDAPGQSAGLSPAPLDAEGAGKQMHDHVESSSIDLKASSDGKENLQLKSSVPETDTKRAKQQFAQRSRVRKLQYIAELERNVQSLQAEGCEVTAELEFLNQQNLILGMENKALKQRLESLAQEQMIKHFEHDVLEREINRLRALYQQQQHQQHQSQQQQKQPSSSHRRSNSKDMDSQFANLSLKHKEKSPSPDNASFLDRVT